MCNFIKKNGEQCLLARNKDRCGKHPIVTDRESIVVGSNIVEEMSPQVNTPVVAEVVDTPAPSVINPVEASNVKVSEVPNVDESIVEPMIADSAVYKEEYNSDSEQLYNSDDSENEVTSTATEVIKPTESQLRRWAYLIVSVNYLENRDEIAEAENLVLDQQQIDVLRKFVEAHTKKNAKGKDIESTLKRDSMDRLQSRLLLSLRSNA
ncbi:Myosin light chain kinase A [Phytophthora nicotianae]|uniref:Myosin light chain kinase A n=1 Tax=Phytophthora nicotianae TaxID=4792 RepID=A0A0W8CN97_PHYNI|nr:Myosin light chain kinase A [Phytophthora nicotianae]